MKDSQLRSLHILVVDDHADTLRFLARHLQTAGHLVMTATTCAEGIAVLSTDPCEVLISDVGLPDGDGWTLLKSAPSRPLFAIAMSGFAMVSDSLKSREAGYNHHLLKPFKIAQLEQLLVEAVETVEAESRRHPPLGSP